MSPWSVAVWAAAAAYVLLISIEHLYDHETFRTGFDVAVYDQRLWLLAHGHDGFSTVVSRPFLADHFEPALVLLTPLYWLGIGVPGILVAQTIALALTAPALYTLARARGATPLLASVPALLWLVSPAVSAVNLFDFRPGTFVPALLVLSVLAAVQGRNYLLFGTAVVALSLKEDIALAYLVLGGILFFQGSRRVGATLGAASLVWFAIASIVIESRGDSYAWFGRRFAGDRGDSVLEAVGWMLRHPLETLEHVLTESGDLVILFVSTGNLALLAPPWALLSLPTALHNALSAYEPQHALVHHYHLLTLTGFFTAAAIGVGRLSSAGRLTRLVVAGGVLGAVALAIVGGISRHDVSGRLGPEERREIHRALDVIPSGSSVAAAPHLLPRLSQRTEVYSLPEPFIPIDWSSPITAEEMAERAAGVQFVAFWDDTKPLEYPGDITKLKDRLLAEGFVVVARSRSGVEVLERREVSSADR